MASKREINITHILEVLVIKLKFLAGKLAEVAYFCQLAKFSESINDGNGSADQNF